MQMTVAQFQKQHNQERNLLEHLLGVVKLQNQRQGLVDLIPPALEETIEIVEKAALPVWSNEQERSALLHDLTHLDLT